MIEYSAFISNGRSKNANRTSMINTRNEGGFTKVPNGLLEKIMAGDYSKRELSVLIYIIRNGYGYHKEQSECDLNVGRIADQIGLDRSHVNETLRNLMKKDLLIKTQNKIRLTWEPSKAVEAETASIVHRLKQPRSKADSASTQGQNSPGNTDNVLTDRELHSSKEKRKSKETPIPPSRFDIKQAEVENIVAYLNEATGKSFKASSRLSKKLIKARLSEGFTFEDLKKVIEVKTSQWKGDKKMDQYLRPETLFGNKFEGYLQTAINEVIPQKAYGFNNLGPVLKGFGL